MLRFGTALILASALVASGCGGGGGGGGGNTKRDVFVRASVGNDANDGLTPATAVATIKRAMTAVVKRGDRIVVGPGDYFEDDIDSRPGVQPGTPIHIYADTLGEFSGDNPGTVVLNATGPFGFQIRGGTYVTIDGFIVRGGVGEGGGGIVIRSDSHHATVKNCEVFDNEGDGIRVQDSTDVTLFNNLVYRNGRTGIRVVGNASAPRTRIINNTVADNGDRGILVGNSNAASTDAEIFNNIIQNNTASNIQVIVEPVDSSVGLMIDSNLVFPARYRPDNLPHTTDINVDALFVNAANDDYHLRSTSPAIDAAMAELDGEMRRTLAERTTTADGLFDRAPFDLGFHYIP